MKNVYLFLVGLILCFNLQGQVSQIIDPLMFGGRLRAFAKTPSCVLVATDGGIFKTTDEGQSWTNATQAFDPKTVSCDQIIKIGTDFYARSNGSNSQNIYKSTDNGATWSQLTFSSWWPRSLGKLPFNLYVVGDDYMSGEGRLYSSTDGISWTPKAIIWTNWQNWGNCELFFFGTDKLYLEFNNTLYYTSDGNTLTTVSTNGLGSLGFFNGDNTLDGDAYGNLFLKGNNVIYQYNFTSGIWTDISTGKIPGDSQIMNLSVTDNAIFLTTMSPTVGISLFRSTDQGGTFSELSTGLAFPMIGNIIEVSATGFIGNGLNDDILISSDGGSTWSSTTNQYIASYAGNLTLSGNSLLFSREVIGLIRSGNQGLSWNTANNGIPGFSGIAYFVRQIIPVKDTLFAFAQPDPYSENVQLYKSSDNGTTWTSSPFPALYNTGTEYSFAGKSDSTLFVNYLDPVSSQYALIISSNNGSSWVKPNAQNNVLKTYLKGPRNCLFAFNSSSSTWEDFSNVYRANSFGMSFTDLNTLGLFKYDFLIKRVSDDRGDKAGPMMDFDAARNKAIFAVRDRIMGTDINRLYLYNITLNAWSEINTSGLSSNYVANNIKYIGNNVWLLAANDGLYKSINGGVDWAITHNPAEWQKGIVVNSIQLIADKAFLGTIANGVWMVDLSLPTAVPEQIIDNDLQVFPNPATGLVNVIIQPDLVGKPGNVSLYNFDGKEIMKRTVNSNKFQLDLNNLPSGSYFLVITSNNHTYKKTIIRR
jgi:photosystem II stability/assembly factor-like uncharacterized protein